MDSIDIKINQLNKNPFSGFGESKLVLDISGKTVNEAVVNTIRRLVMDHIPTYAFCKESIDITTNTSIFDNDCMRLRLSQLTLPDIQNNVIDFPDKFWKNVYLAAAHQGASSIEAKIYADDAIDNFRKFSANRDNGY